MLLGPRDNIDQALVHMGLCAVTHTSDRVHMWSLQLALLLSQILVQDIYIR